MALRTDFPNTNGSWAPAPGYPLVEIKSDGTGVNVGSRPAGGRELSQMGEGERAAYMYQSTAYFQGEAAAQAQKSDLSVFTAATTAATNAGVVNLADVPPELRAAIQRQEEQRAKDLAQANAVLASGSFQTPAPIPADTHTGGDAPPATPVITSQISQSIRDAATVPNVDPVSLSIPGATLEVPGSSSSTDALVVVGCILAGLAGVWLYRRGGL